MRRPRLSRRSGFTMLEALVVLLLMGVLVTFGYPALDKMMQRSKLQNGATEAAVLMRLARLESVRRGVPAVVQQSFDATFATNTLLAFVDYSEPPDSVFTNGTDLLLREVQMPNGVFVAGPGDTDTGDHANASSGFVESADGEGTVVFAPSGSADRTGAFRFSDRRGNSLEARLDPAATGRVSVRKYDGDGDPEDPANWEEPGEVDEDPGDPPGWEWS